MSGSTQFATVQALLLRVHQLTDTRRGLNRHFALDRLSGVGDATHPQFHQLARLQRLPSTAGASSDVNALAIAAVSTAGLLREVEGGSEQYDQEVGDRHNDETCGGGWGGVFWGGGKEGVTGLSVWRPSGWVGREAHI